MAGFVLHGNMFKSENPSYNKDSVEVSGVEALAAVSLGEDKAALDEEDKITAGIREVKDRLKAVCVHDIIAMKGVGDWFCPKVATDIAVTKAEVAVDAIESGVVLTDPSAPVGPVPVAGTSTAGS
eukprot:gene611-668_t